ncbi:RNA 2'-phosphotransferase [Niveibacterium sp. COAC-50]|uniref:RNA 2'-phosphotransferase n=1 Tax=Niveibacterium sp. COAC-50 TaxID=2729384 RepID=UPI00155625CD|nr:RNA 2'-phosphotransferase [Niveibacterium sp. COAC-50]
MQTENQLKRLSKFMSLVLRHQPELIGIALDHAGWVAIDELVTRANAAGKPLTHACIREVVATSDKQRFAISDDGLRIRANQGHSVEVELGLAPAEPPDVLLHGTARRFLSAILREGLVKGARHHVHLTTDLGIAGAVGRRYGELVLLSVAAARMRADGHVFYRSDNGVWLTDMVPPRYLEVLD